MVASASIYVIDGDTIDIAGERYRLVGFDTPETYRAACLSEKAMGALATARLRELIAAEPKVALFIEPNRDKYDRGLARLVVGGRPVADTLIFDGLARPYDGGTREGWC